MMRDLPIRMELNKLETKAAIAFLVTKLGLLNPKVISHIINITSNIGGICLCLHDHQRVPAMPYDIQDHTWFILA